MVRSWFIGLLISYLGLKTMQDEYMHIHILELERKRIRELYISDLHLPSRRPLCPVHRTPVLPRIDLVPHQFLLISVFH